MTKSRNRKLICVTSSNECLNALGMPLWQSRKTLHERKDNSLPVPAKPLAASTYLYSILSELYDA